MACARTDEALVALAAVIERVLEVGGRAVRAGCVEGVATANHLGTRTAKGCGAAARGTSSRVSRRVEEKVR